MITLRKKCSQYYLLTIEAEKRKYEEYEREHSVLAFKAAYVSCTKCGSKLNREYLKSDTCPICRTDMRSDTTQSILARYFKKICDLKNEQLREGQQKVFCCSFF